MAEHRSHTFCRVCEPACGLVAVVRDGALVKLEPDRAHPVTQGFACNKGLAGDEIHRDPDRVDYPLRRTEDGRFERVSWDEAIEQIAARLRGLIDAHGPECIAPYIGNPTAFNTLAGPAIAGLFAQLGCRRSFSSGTQDCANKFAGSEAVFGSATMHPVPDLAHTDVFLSFGANPRVSHASFMSIADPIGKIKQAVKRGARVHHINPREIEPPARGAGDTVLVRPDTDVYLLAALIHEIDEAGGFDADVVAAHGRNVQALREFVKRYPAQRVARITGLSVDSIRSLAMEFSQAGAASVHMSTGVNMGRQGTLAYWLLHMLSFVTGNLDRRGGNILSHGFYASAKAGRRDIAESFRETEFGSLRKGSLPGNLLGEYVTDVESPLRALFVIAGNPVLSIGGEQKIRRALEALDLVVAIDLYRNATAEYADFILPATDPFERSDINITGLGLQPEPWIQFSEPVVEPRGERREEWWILGRIAQAMGLRSPFDAGDAGEGAEAGPVIDAMLWSRIDHMLGSRGISLDDVRAEPHGVVFEPLAPGRFFGEQIQTADGRVDCCPAAFAPALERCESIFESLEAEAPDQLKLITLRDPYMHNSWYANLPRMKRGTRDRNPLHVHPDDAQTRGFAAGDKLRLWNEHGALEAEVVLDDSLMPGVVALTHGWGNARTPGMRVAHETPGINPNVLLPTGPGSFEPLSSQAFMTGVPVDLARL
jgi:anaerobic selenocysteine-containing dehydrogenase